MRSTNATSVPNSSKYKYLFNSVSIVLLFHLSCTVWQCTCFQINILWLLLNHFNYVWMWQPHLMLSFAFGAITSLFAFLQLTNFSQKLHTQKFSKMKFNESSLFCSFSFFTWIVFQSISDLIKSFWKELFWLCLAHSCKHYLRYLVVLSAVKALSV